MAVREDFFAGFTGNAERLARGMARTERVLAATPDHAEALVWHGGGLLFLADRPSRAETPPRGRSGLARGLAR